MYPRGKSNCVCSQQEGQIRKLKEDSASSSCPKMEQLNSDYTFSCKYATKLLLLDFIAFLRMKKRQAMSCTTSDFGKTKLELAKQKNGKKNQRGKGWLSLPLLIHKVPIMYFGVKGSQGNKEFSLGKEKPNLGNGSSTLIIFHISGICKLHLSVCMFLKNSGYSLILQFLLEKDYSSVHTKSQISVRQEAHGQRLLLSFTR